MVDDGSTDGTAAIARGYHVKVLRPAHTVYAGGARNRGWDEAAGEVVVFLDSDAVPAPGWGAGLRRALGEFQGALVGCARTLAFPSADTRPESNTSAENRTGDG